VPRDRRVAASPSRADRDRCEERSRGRAPASPSPFAAGCARLGACRGCHLRRHGCYSSAHRAAAEYGNVYFRLIRVEIQTKKIHNTRINISHKLPLII
jgi:DTW domain-containing protein YfiP